MKKILGISAFFHDSSATIIGENRIIAAAQEERFTRIKNTSDFPINAIKYCLEESGYSIAELDAVVFYDKPLLKFERILETYYKNAPRGIISFLKSVPIWLDQKLFIKKLIKDELRKITREKLNGDRLLFSEHHLSHAASTYYMSPFEESAILVIDGVGEWTTTSISIGKGSEIVGLEEIRYPNSIGLLYSSFTQFLGFKVNSGEYKVMGLAPYGNPTSHRVKNYIERIKQNLIQIHSDGSYSLNQSFFSYSTSLTMIDKRKWERLFGVKARLPESALCQEHCDLAFAIQKVIDELVGLLAQRARSITGSKNICLAGGVALNCVTNGHLYDSNIFENIFIQPASGDAGGSLGAALVAKYLYFGENRDQQNQLHNIQNYFLGPQYSYQSINLMNRRFKAISQTFTDQGQLNDTVSELLVQGNIVGWFQDRMEFGPRALGNRSILSDPRPLENQQKINVLIKKRESFRPFAPAILQSELTNYFQRREQSPYMLFVHRLHEDKIIPVDEHYWELDMLEKLTHPRSGFQAITHVDFSARIQTVDPTSNTKFAALIESFFKLTGCPMLVNTSFNLRGEPIVCSPIDAYRCFMNTDMDYLIIENQLYSKEEQPKHSHPDLQI